MNHAWEKSVFQGNVEGYKNEQSTMLGKAQMDLSGAKALSENIPSIGPLDHNPEKRPLPVSSQPSGGGQPPLVFTPASLQLAQLQAQLTLHRLKLAQTAASSNTAAAATVLNQVLSNVAMSQPFFSQLRAPTLISAAPGQPAGAQLAPGFPPGALAFPPQSSALGPLVGGGFGGGSPSPNPGGMRLDSYGSGLPQPPGPQASEFGKKADSAFPSSCQQSSDRTQAPVTARADGGNQDGFQRDYFELDDQGRAPAFAREQKPGAFHAGGLKDQQWQGFSQAGQLDVNASTVTTWAPRHQPPFDVRAELYNPEEPTPDPKFHPASGATGAQEFDGYQLFQSGEDAFSGGPVPLQPHQLNDFHAVTPEHLPHQCTICDKKVYNLKDWDHHVKGKLHLQNCMLYTEGTSAGSANFPESSQGCLSSSLNNSMAYSSSANQDMSSGSNVPYLNAAPMMTHPLPGVGFTLPLSGLKFPLRKSGPGRVVHICNLPEGSCTENDVINLGLPFGKVTNYILMRSTHQAFLEMAYVEAAQAMVKYYQLNPATINEQKLLIRMSKRYQELQLKKPGKDVESIIQDINSQRERHEKQEIECCAPERVRSRSPVSRSLSPHSHSPSFTSCSSAHSPPGPGRAQRNGLGPRRPSWDWCWQAWQDERDGACWRNGDQDQGDGRPPEWRRACLKVGDGASPRTVEEGLEGPWAGRDRYTRSSPQAQPFLPHRSKEADFYNNEPLYTQDKPPRPVYQRHEAKAKRRDTPENHRPRHSESEPPEAPMDPSTAEDKRQASLARAKGKKPSRTQGVEKMGEEVEENQKKDNTASPLSSCEKVEPSEVTGGKDREAKDWDSGEETEGEIWYPGNMEELVTVDEVGEEEEEEEEDSIIEPDLPTERQEEAGVASQVTASQDPKKGCVRDEETDREGSSDTLPALQKRADDMSKRLAGVERQAGSDLSAFLKPALQAVLDDKRVSVTTDAPRGQLRHQGLSDHRDTCGGPKPSDFLADCDTGSLSPIANDAYSKDKHLAERKDVHSASLRQSPRQLGVEVLAARSASWEQKVFNKHSIPLGVEFIVPRSGFYCKLCGLFYTSEEKAKTTHCRSTIHYRNLQKYLNGLAQESMHKKSMLPDPASTE